MVLYSKIPPTGINHFILACLHQFFIKVCIVKFRAVQDVGDVLPEVLHCTSRRRWKFKSLSYDENGNEESNLRM